MVVLDMRALRAGLVPGQRLIGIDPGSRMVGVALSDVSLSLASPYASLPRGKLIVLAAALGEIVRAEGVGGLVIGLPLALDGSAGPAAQAARDWAHAMSRATGLPAAMWDERLSTAAVNRLLIGAADMTRTKRGAVVDRMAAAYILQSALDASR